MSPQAKHFYEFGPFRLDTEERCLLRKGEPIPLPPKTFDTLLVLVKESGHLVTKDELIAKVWPETFVEENNLAQHVSLLRKLLRQRHGRSGPRYIETVPKQGYRFAPGVKDVWDEEPDLIVGTRTKLRVVVKEEKYEEEYEGQANDERAIDTTSSIANLCVSRSRWQRKHRYALTACLLIGLAVALPWTINRARKTETSRTAPLHFKSIAVLPFQLIGEHKEDEYLGLGFADTLITRLSSLRQLNVYPISAVQRYTGPRDAVAAGRDLGADAVLDGRIQRNGTRIRVTAQLVSVRDGSTLWASQFDENLNAIFSLQDAFSNQVTLALNLSLSAEETARLTERGTDQPDAYQAYMRGRFFWNKRTEEAFKTAVEHFQEAIRLDPSFAQAYAGLADAYSFLGQREHAKEAARRALELDESLAEAHASLGGIFLFEWKWDESEHELRRAIELNASYATAHHWYAYYLAARGRIGESLAEIERAQVLDPLSLIINTDMGQIYYYARQYDRAVEQLQRTMQMDPGFVMARYRIGETYARSGRYENAIAETREAMSRHNVSVTPGVFGYVYAMAGRRDAALRAINELQKTLARLPEYAPGHSYWIATIYAALGERDQAFYWLKKACNQHVADVALLQVEPRLDPLRSDPRFRDLLVQMRLASE